MLGAWNSKCSINCDNFISKDDDNKDDDDDDSIDDTRNGEEYGDSREDDKEFQHGNYTVQPSQNDTMIVKRYLHKGKAVERLALKRKRAVNAEDELLQEATSALKSLTAATASESTRPTTSDDVDELFAKYIAAELRSITDPRKKQLIKFRIQAMLYETQWGSTRNGNC